MGKYLDKHHTLTKWYNPRGIGHFDKQNHDMEEWIIKYPISHLLLANSSLENTGETKSVV